MSPGVANRLDSKLAGELFDAISDAGDTARLGIVVTLSGADPRSIFVSAGAASILGYEPEELLEVPIWEFIDPAELPRLVDLHRRRLAGEERIPTVIETIAIGKSGEKIPVETATSRVEIAGEPANVTFLFDLSERRRAQEALARSEARFRSVVENAPDGVAILRGPVILYLNAAAGRMLGYDPPESGVGQSIVDVLHPEDAAKAAERIGRLLRTGGRFAEPAEYRTQKPGGNDVTVEISSIPIEYDGAPAVLGFARDVTDRKAIQAKLVQADRLAAVGTLAAGVAHEINNPLAYMTLSLRYLERELAKLDIDEVVMRQLLERVAEARHGSERVGTIVRDLTAFARADDDRRGPVSVVEAVEDAIRIVDNEIRHRAKLVRDFADLPPVNANPARLEQVFLNLLVNATHALEDGKPDRDEIRVSLSATGDGHVVAAITDTGPGIPTDVVDRVFDPFFTTKPVGMGTGLGLPICQGIVAGLDGDIEIDSREGEGTTVRVRLPASKGHSEFPASPESKPQSAPTRRGHVLIVDDEPIVARLLSNMLEDEHDISVATSAREALDILAENAAVDAILCDVMMPGMTGMDLHASICERHPGLERQMIFMTGGAFVPRVAKFLGRVDNPRLDKPFEYEDVLAVLRDVVTRVEERRRTGSDSPSDP